MKSLELLPATVQTSWSVIISTPVGSSLTFLDLLLIAPKEEAPPRLEVRLAEGVGEMMKLGLSSLITSFFFLGGAPATLPS